ncbi:uncharacterized protein LOC134295546 isoform X2 [Anolis carolinensis]|uniref:uncharacterized protein LOC134295546 isoform X2 n=1 Tax=Anolis carolinensis TaxID=28377 RepID=UPI002F2B7C87
MADPEPLLELTEDRIISDAEETKCEITEESNHEKNKPQGDRTMSQAIREVTQGRTISDKEVNDKQSQNLNQKTGICSSTTSKVTLPRKGFHDGSQQLLSSDFHRNSIGHHSLPSPKIFQQQHENEVTSNDNSRHWVSTRSGKERQNKFNQTSCIWERKPLSEILHPSTEISQRSENAESNVLGGKQDGTPVGETETFPQDHFQNSQVSEGEKVQSSKQESKQSISPSMEMETQGGEQHAELEQAEDDGHLLSTEGQCLKSKIPSQLQQTDETSINSDVVWISPKTGKEMKSSTTQTNFPWDRKTLAEYLQSVSMVEEVLGSNISPTEIKWLSVEEYPPQNQEPENHESHQSTQQPNGLVSQHDSQRSVEHHSLLNQTTFQLQQANKEDTMWIRHKTGQDVKCSSTQTSFIWDEKRLGEYLQPPCTEGEMLSLDTKAVSSMDTVPATAFIFPSPPKAEQPFVPAVPLVTPESEKHELSAFSLFPRCDTQPSVEHHSLLSQTTSQLQQASKASINEDTVWIRHKIGQDVKCSTTQTSFFWDGKRLVEYLHPTSKEGEMLTLESTAAASVDTVPQGQGAPFIFSSPSDTEQPFVPAIPLVTPESEKHDLSALTLFTRSGSPPSNEYYSLLSQTSQPQQTNKASINEDTMWIRQKTGLDVKCSTTQTSLFWDGKRFVEHLQCTSKEGEMLNFVSVASASVNTVPVGPGRVFISSHPAILLDTPESEKHDVSAHTLFTRRGTQPSIEHYSLLSQTTPQVEQTNIASINEDTMWIRQKTGLDVKCSTTQTSLFWDGKRFVEHLHPTSKDGEMLNFVSVASASVDTMPLGPRRAFISSHPSILLDTPESEKHDVSAHTLFTRRGTQSSSEHYSLLSQTTPQLEQTNKASLNEDTMWIRQKTGLDVKCSTTQTSLFWDGKRLVEYLHLTSKEGKMLNFVSVASASVDTVPLGPGRVFISSHPSILLDNPESEKHDISAHTLFTRRGTQSSRRYQRWSSI